MTTKVTENGVLIPRELLGDFDEVEIRRENGHLILIGVAPDGKTNSGQDMAAALEEVARLNAFADIEASRWQREERAERSLPERDA